MAASPTIAPCFAIQWRGDCVTHRKACVTYWWHPDSDMWAYVRKWRLDLAGCRWQFSA